MLENRALNRAIFCLNVRLLLSLAPKFLATRKHKGTVQGRVSHPQQQTAAFPGSVLPYSEEESLRTFSSQVPGRADACSPAPDRRLDFQPRLEPAPLPAPGEPRGTPQRRSTRRLASRLPPLGLGGAAASPPRSLPSARCHLNSLVDSWAEAERAFAKGEGGRRRARAPLPGGAAPVGGAVARSPPAKPLAPRSHPTRGCSGGLRGLARGRASTGARASGCVPPGLHRSPPTPGWALPVRNDHPAIGPALRMLHLGLPPATIPDAPAQRKGAKGALPVRAPAGTAALRRTLQHFRALAPLPSPPASFTYPTIVANQSSSLSKRMAFAGEEREWLVAHAPRWAT